MYRVIDTAIWTDPKIRELSRDAKLFFVYLITNQHAHLSGIYYLPRALIKHELGFSDRVLDTVSDTLSGAALADFDANREVIWVRNMFRYQGKGEKNYRAAGNQLATLHKSPLIKEFLELYPEVRRYAADTLSDTVSDTPSRVGIQEQEQEQEKEKNIAHREDDTPRYLTAKGKKLNGWKLEAFERFWEKFGLKKGRAKAADAWLSIPALTKELCERQIFPAAEAEAMRRPILAGKGLSPKWAQGWLTDRRWEDEENAAVEQKRTRIIPAEEALRMEVEQA